MLLGSKSTCFDVGALVPDDDGLGLFIPSAGTEVTGADVAGAEVAGAEVTVVFWEVVVSSAISSQYGGIEEDGPLKLAGAVVTVSGVIVSDGTEGAGDAIVTVTEEGDAVAHWIFPKQVMPLGHVPLGHGVALAQFVAAVS